MLVLRTPSPIIATLCQREQQIILVFTSLTFHQ
ncbi:hypothetical protein T12_12975 [Trichinella patagoniensis]|uniref:Uncharacterized protein n=1 Tax=Trichinella patagoniensis TaxID=990121 RepID=A0A0V0YPP3_9BILA|nr:hypothetical protein T12_12975 [Trichinella patagoniensis]